MSNNQNPINLKSKTIGKNKVVLNVVPASVARKVQMSLGAIIIQPLADAFQNGGGLEGIKEIAKKNNSDKKPEVSAVGISAGITGVANIIGKLSEGEFDRLIDQISPYILIDGKPFNEDLHFSSSELMDEYETIWYFLEETFGDFIAAVLSRFPQLTKATA